MKRFLPLCLVVLCIVICMFVGRGDFYKYSSQLCCGYSILVNKDNHQVVELYDVSLCDVLDNFNVEVVSKLELDGRIVVEGWSNLLNGGVSVNGLKVNIQISFFDNKCIVGTPLIDGAF